MEPKKPITVTEFIKQAKTVNDNAFLVLINGVISLLEKEQKKEETNCADGRLACLSPSGDVIIIGDLHGDIESLAYILKNSRFVENAQKGEDVHLVFLGDYGDRGSAQPEVYWVVLRLKELFPEKVILMRGNHEGPEDMIPCPHDLPIQLKQKYGEKAGAKLMAQLRKLFTHLYTAVIIEEVAVLIHGGVPSKAESIRDLAYAHKSHPKETYLEEMLWSDPQEDLVGTQVSPRGAGKLFGADVTEKLLKMLNVQVLIRGHESCPEGFKINHNKKVLTLFSTNKPPYSNKYGAYLQLNLAVSFKNVQQIEKNIQKFE